MPYRSFVLTGLAVATVVSMILRARGRNGRGRMESAPRRITSLHAHLKHARKSQSGRIPRHTRLPFNRYVLSPSIPCGPYNPACCRGMFLQPAMASRLASSSSSSAVTRGDLHITSASASDQMDPEDVRYWEHALSFVDRPSAKNLIEFVDPSVPLGITIKQQPKRSGRSSATTPTTKRIKAPALHRDFVKWKKQHPRHVLLVRVGEFYETQGIDAIMLVQHASLNPMGNPSNPPRAGCPKQNIQRTLDDLTNAGLSAAVYEERPSSPASSSSSGGGATGGLRKTRFLAQIVTPGFPNYLFGRLEAEGGGGRLARGVSGCTLLRYYADERRLALAEGVTEDFVELFLKSSPPSQLLLHRSPASVSSGGGSSSASSSASSSVEAKWEARMRRMVGLEGLVSDVRAFTAKDVKLGFLAHIRRDLGLPEDVEIQTHVDIQVAGEGAGQSRPCVVDSTASNLGLYPTRGIVPLAQSLVSSHSPALCKSFLLSLLLSPPPRAIAQDINTALRILLKVPELSSVPTQYLIPNGKIHSLLYAQEASVSESKRKMGGGEGERERVRERRLFPRALLNGVRSRGNAEAAPPPVGEGG
eukprot:jgi/Bigna1/77916/fgenesh1_pg.51_\